MSVNISIKSRKLEYELEIREKITFVLGDSATGKTQMVSLINSFGNPSVKISVSNGFDLVSISESEFSKFIKHANRRIHENKYSSLKEYWDDMNNFPITNSVIVIDDENFVDSKEFATFVNADKYNYYIIINRTQISKIGYSVYEAYELKTDGKSHWLDRKYNSPVGDNQCLNPDFIITEGIGSDFQFFKKHYSNSGARILNPSYNNKNKNTGGKNNLITMISENVDEFRGKKVILFIDISAFGAEYESLVNMCRENYIQAYVNKNYLSFEYLLLNTNLINDTGLSDFQQVNLLKYATLEKLFTDRLRQVLSAQKLITYSKSKLSICLLEDCCNNARYRSELCNKRTQYQGKNKLEVLLEGTKFQYMLQWKN